MMHNKANNDSAFPLRTMDILKNVLSHAGNPGELGICLTEELRELTDSRCTILVQRDHEGSHCTHRIVCVNPERHLPLAQSPEMERFIGIVDELTEARLWQAEEISEGARVLNHLGFRLSLTLPLYVGDIRMGVILVLGLPDERNVAEGLDFLKTLSTIVALVMRNAFFYEQQDQIIAKRTRQLRENQALLQAVIEGTTDAVFVKEPDGRYLLINQTAAGLVGKSAETIIGNDDTFLFPPNVAASLMAADQQILAGGKTITLEERVSVEGKEIVFLSTKGPLFGGEGALVGLFGISRDITVRDKSEQALRESEELFRTLSDSAPIGIFKTDCRGNIGYTNPRWREFTGISAEETTVQGWIRSIHPDDRAEADKLWLESTVTGGDYAHEYRLLTAQQETVWVRTLASPLYGPDGSVTGYVGTVEDITEQLRAKQDMLKTQKLESLGVLAGGIAHDFNNILTVILGNISLSRIQAHDPEKVAQRLEDAENAAARAKDLTQQLLTFSRGGDPVKKVIKLGKLLKEAAGFAIHGSAAKCEFVLADDLWPVEADEGQLIQVIHNLVLNAVQAMPDGGKITVAAKNTKPLPEGKRFVEISVTDTGTGVLEHIQQRIFDPYFTTKQQGNGLGLASCYSIIKKHDGTITVESTLGRGTTFYIRLPAAERVEETDPAARLEVTRGKGRILVMDDEEMVRVVAKASLEELGYLVECTKDGGEAVEFYRRRKEEGTPFDAVIMDLTIPGGIGGKEAITSLIMIDPNVKAIVCSGYASNPVMADYREYGFSAVLSKPYRLHEMSKVLQDVLDTVL